ncbi:MAG: Integrase catalytic region, partial [Conexibacter sp.]|nr:Integrase catalytic region [Conexibacter sp.]
PHRTPQERVQLIAALRRLRMTGAEIALCTGMALSTVSAVLNRIGLGKLSRLDPPEPPNRYDAPVPANCCTSTSRSSAGSTPAPGIA